MTSSFRCILTAVISAAVLLSACGQPRDEAASAGAAAGPTAPPPEHEPGPNDDPPDPVSCSYSDFGAAPAEAGGTPAAIAEPVGVTGRDRYDALDLRLAVNATEVPAGCEVTGWLLVANDSGDTVVVQDCELGLGRAALVPAADPDAELWIQPVADCAGDVDIPDGYEGEWGSFDFYAATMFGELLEPGDHLAALEIAGWSGRFEIPVTVVPGPPTTEEPGES